jgi:hypothetical protein
MIPTNPRNYRLFFKFVPLGEAAPPALATAGRVIAIECDEEVKQLVEHAIPIPHAPALPTGPGNSPPPTPRLAHSRQPRLRLTPTRTSPKA